MDNKSPCSQMLAADYHLTFDNLCIRIATPLMLDPVPFYATLFLFYTLACIGAWVRYNLLYVTRAVRHRNALETLHPLLPLLP